MALATVGDLRELLKSCSDDQVLIFRIYEEGSPDTLVYSSETEKGLLTADEKHGYQTYEGDRHVVRINLHLDLDRCDI